MVMVAQGIDFKYAHTLLKNGILKVKNFCTFVTLTNIALELLRSTG
jgi:hypothetical protein